MLSATLDDARMQPVEPAKTAEEALGQLTEVLRSAHLSKGKGSSLKLQLDQIVELHGDATSSGNEQSSQPRMLNARIDLLNNKLDTTKQNEWTGCDMEVICSKVANTKGEMDSLEDGLRRDTFD